MTHARPTAYGWQFYVRIDGRLVTEHFRPHELKNGREPTPREVEQWVGTQRALASGAVTRTTTPDAPTLAEEVPVYLSLIRTMPTYRWRVADLDRWLPVLGHLPRSAITAPMIRAQLEHWRAEGYAASTVNHRRTALMHLWTVLDGKSARNPARDTPRYREPQAPPRDISAAATDAILNALADGPMKARLLLMRWTGWPQQQIRTLTESQIRWRVAVQIGRSKGKGVEPSWLPILPQAWSALERMKDLKAWGDFRSDAMRAAFRRAAKRARTTLDLPDAVRAELADVTPYQLRHAFGTLVSGITKDDRATMALMVHSDIRQTHRYTGATVDPRTAAAVAAVSEALATLATFAGDDRVRAGNGGKRKPVKSRTKGRK